MNLTTLAAALLLLCGQSCASECVIRVAYPDRERPPYYFGNGAVVPEIAGAGADLLRLAVRSVGCTAELVRLPAARIRLALISGSVDLAPVDLRDGEEPYSALPMKAGQLDARRGMRMTAVVYVRAGDGLPADLNTRDYFMTHTLVTNQGSPLGEQLRDEGFKVDGGAPDAYSNMDKVAIRRADGFAISIANIEALDAVIAARHGAALMRLAIPVRKSTLWLSASNAYFARNPERVEAVWQWWGENSTRRLAEFVKNYPVQN
ncbi:hypothetical protein SAMN05428959_1082 [Duganella sp. CF517]|uniref:hypothetical protein n=1 Tax=Duganella sp. CF517 TaxID=1881038 RepID=UPI0008C978CF|nr:hypothetical protein [Duganella sp. CF517]SEO43494.1 hypothetical protein SAMN05428959_1082 [Duganella sp. CF517]